MVIDVHSHLNDVQFDADKAEVIARMKMAGVAAITVGTDLEMSRKAIEIAEANGWWATVGQHPTDTKEYFGILKFRDLAKNPRAVAIGECGLDYFHGKGEEEKTRQKKLFEQQVVLAKELDKPLMIHCREAYEDMLGILTRYQLRITRPGNVHFFSGTWETARKFLDLGFSLSFPGTITFTHQYDEVVKNVPGDLYLLETDSPYVAPAPYRGKRNEPGYVLEVAKKVAETRGTSFEQVVAETTTTARRLFAI